MPGIPADGGSGDDDPGADGAGPQGREDVAAGQVAAAAGADEEAEGGSRGGEAAGRAGPGEVDAGGGSAGRRRGGVGGGVPECCPWCGDGWKSKDVFWAEPSLDPEWGYLVFCPAGHWNWYWSPVPAAEIVEALESRFGRLQDEMRADGG